MSTILPFLAQAVSDPNWVLIGSLVGGFIILAILLMLPSKPKLEDKSGSPKAIEDKSKKTDAKKKIVDEEIDKEHLSLAEIKDSKRESAADLSKEELRELRKERRAATQTDKAVQKLEEKEDVKKEESGEKNASEKTDDVKKEEKAEETQDAEKAEEEKAEEMAAPIENVITSNDTDASDVFASLFGEESELFDENNSDLDFNLGEQTTAAGSNDGTIFPTLGSALIPLSELTESAKDAKEKNVDPLDELTKRLTEKAEKKTLN